MCKGLSFSSFFASFCISQNKGKEYLLNTCLVGAVTCGWVGGGMGWGCCENAYSLCMCGCE